MCEQILWHMQKVNWLKNPYWSGTTISLSDYTSSGIDTKSHYTAKEKEKRYKDKFAKLNNCMHIWRINTKSGNNNKQKQKQK